MSDDWTEESDGDRQALQAKRSPSVASGRTPFVADMAARQAPFLDLIGQFHKLFWDLPALTTRDVDTRLQPMFDKLMEASSVVGISRMSVPSLKECCGKRRVWSDPLDKSQILSPVEDVPQGFRLGDFLKKIFTFLGFKPCNGCERRRQFLNRIGWRGK